MHAQGFKSSAMLLCRKVSTVAKSASTCTHGALLSRSSAVGKCASSAAPGDGAALLSDHQRPQPVKERNGRSAATRLLSRGSDILPQRGSSAHESTQAGRPLLGGHPRSHVVLPQSRELVHGLSHSRKVSLAADCDVGVQVPEGDLHDAGPRKDFPAPTGALSLTPMPRLVRTCCDARLWRTGPDAHATPLEQTCCDASLSHDGISQMTMANAFAVVRL